MGGGSSGGKYRFYLRGLFRGARGRRGRASGRPFCPRKPAVCGSGVSRREDGVPLPGTFVSPRPLLQTEKAEAQGISAKRCMATL